MGLDIYFHKTQTIKIGYFRKVNFLVRYFSDKYDLENCRPVEITVDDIKELIERCHNVLQDHSSAPQLLPTCSGFFFGNTEYNDFYFEDVYKVLCFCKAFIEEYDEDDIDSNLTFTIDY